MAHDALERSLSEQDLSLERQVRDLQAILGHLLSTISETQGKVESNEGKIGRCAAMAASASARAELAIVKAQESVHAADLLARVADAAEMDGPRHVAPKPKRDRHGLHIVAGAFTLLIGVLAGVRAAAWATTARKAATMAVTLAAAGGIAVAPALQSTGATDPTPAPHHFRDTDDYRHHVRHHDHVPASLPQQRTATIRRRKRHTVAASAPPPPPSPDPSPSNQAPTPDPSPSPTLSVPPSPAPSVGMMVPLQPLAPVEWDH